MPAVAMSTTSALLGLKTCFPKTGAELEQAVVGPDCTVVVLTNGYAADYKIREVMNVTAYKVLVGNPIDVPKLNATNKIERLFNVMPGGRLDIRAVCLYKGGGRSLNGGRTKLTVGGAIKVYPGGSFRGTGIIFRQSRSTLEGFLNELRSPAVAKRTFGGMVFVAGGHFVCFGCQIVRFNPYGSPDVNQIQVGGNFLVVLGACSCIGCYNVGFNLFSASINVGSNAAVLGGALSLIGGGNSGATTAVGQFRAGQSNFVGGGVLVMVGFQDISIVLVICRAGFGQQAVGGGVLMLIGHLEVRLCLFFVGDSLLPSSFRPLFCLVLSIRITHLHTTTPPVLEPCLGRGERVERRADIQCWRRDPTIARRRDHEFPGLLVADRCRRKFLCWWGRFGIYWHGTCI